MILELDCSSGTYVDVVSEGDNEMIVPSEDDTSKESDDDDDGGDQESDSERVGNKYFLNPIWLEKRIKRVFDTST